MDQTTTLLQQIIFEIRKDLARAIPDWGLFEPKLNECLTMLASKPAGLESMSSLFELLAPRPEALRIVLRALARSRVDDTSMIKGMPPGYIAPDTKWITVPIYYATDRARTISSLPNKIYSADRGNLEFGRAEVSVPFAHGRGSFERPSWWKFELRENPEKHIVLLKVSPLTLADYVADIRADLKQTGETDALVFVHGYYVSFADAARRTAQLAFDLEFRGVPILYSWPSDGSLVGYQKDETNVKWSEPHFEAFLGTLLEKLGIKSVHIIAHSMGNRLVTETLKSYVGTASPDKAKVSQVIFAAPDVDTDIFVQVAEKFKGKAQRFTLYASSRDVALAFSQALHRYPRAGDSGDGLTLVEGIDTIDASEVDTDLLSAKHSYYGSARSILSDIFELMKYGESPDERFGLEPIVKGGKQYWWYAP